MKIGGERDLSPMLLWQNFGVFFVHSMYFIASIYLYTWFIRLLQPPRRLRHTIRLIFIILVGSLLTGKILGRYEFNSFSYFLSFSSSTLYVSRGVGTGGPPMRLGSPPELVYIRLHSPT